ncbi:MAG: hypothetical protein EXR18_04010 [Flavobacteriaceae bacterium]|nr:hypothetical protein [Flavobacteriaceae bacterium]
MSQNTNNSDNQEIDLTLILNKIKGFYDGIGTSIFRGILFFKRNLLIVGILFVAGAALGAYIDSNNETYDSKIIVRPNFGSTDYLYSKIDLLDSKIKDQDTTFLKSIGIEFPKNIKLIKIEPIVDIYSLVNYNEKNASVTANTQNFELLKLLAEDGDVNKVIKDRATSKNYYCHSINLLTKGHTTEEKTIKPIIEFLNNNSYFERIKKINIENAVASIKKDEEMILQINTLLEKFSTASGQKSDKLVFYNENTELNEVLKTKQALVYEIGVKKEQLVNFENILQNSSSILNIKNTESVNGKLKFVLPLLLIFGFVLIRLFSKFYKRQALKAQQNIA